MIAWRSDQGSSSTARKSERERRRDCLSYRCTIAGLLRTKRKNGTGPARVRAVREARFRLVEHAQGDAHEVEGASLLEGEPTGFQQLVVVDRIERVAMASASAMRTGRRSGASGWVA